MNHLKGSQAKNTNKISDNTMVDMSPFEIEPKKLRKNNPTSDQRTIGLTERFVGVVATGDTGGATFRGGAG